MPVPGPRTQQRPLPGYNNPAIQARPNVAGETYRRHVRTATGPQIPGRRWNRWHLPAPVADMGRTPGLMFVSRNTHVLGAGIVRRYWRQLVNYIPAQPHYSWAGNRHEQGAAMPVGVTRALRYMTLCVSKQAGTDGTHFAGLHTKIIPQQRQSRVAGGRAGLVRSRPTVRNRISSFGSRVQPLNQSVPGAE